MSTDDFVLPDNPTADEIAMARHQLRSMARHIETLLAENKRLKRAVDDHADALTHKRNRIDRLYDELRVMTNRATDAEIERAQMYERCKPYLELPF